MNPRAGVSLQTGLLGLVALVLLVAFLPGGAALFDRLGSALEDKAREDLALAPQVMADRWAATADMRMMHAKDLSSVAGLAGALADGDSARATSIVSTVGTAPPETPLLVSGAGSPWEGPAPTPELIEATRQGLMPVSVVATDRALSVVALAPVLQDSAWVGAAGVVVALNDAWAGTLAGLTRSDVLVSDPDGALAAASVDRTVAEPLARALAANDDQGARPSDSLPAGTVTEVQFEGTRYLAARGTLDGVATVVFVRDLDRELAVLPELRRIAAVTAAGALGFALLVGALFAGRLARPVRALAHAAEGFARGDRQVPLPTSRVTEVSQVADAFADMRTALADRLEDLQAANAELKDRQDRLAVLQAELLQRDRLASAGSLLAQLAHEIRNPIASVRNCLEVLRRRTTDDPESREFAEMAIDELLRMHELTEQMMDLHRPRDPDAHCNAVTVAEEVATLTRAGAPQDADLDITVEASGPAEVAMSADALKQVLLNLTRNAAEVVSHRGVVELVIDGGTVSVVVRVQDDGPGIDEEALPRIFDPFFTTKSELQGVGLGLFTAEGLVRTYGGRISAENRPGGGASFRVEIPAVNGRAS